MTMKKWILILCGFLLTAYVMNEIFVELTRQRIVGLTVSFLDESAADSRNVIKTLTDPQKTSEAYKSLDKPVPFEETSPFGEEGDNWSNPLSCFGGGGVTVFDANGDGRADVYLSFDGQNWTRPSDESGVLADKPRLLSNMLFMNVGNDKDGNPQYKAIDELCKNDTYVEEELLVEDYLFPRKSVKESKQRYGRASNVAVVADFNNDGRLDIMVGNQPPGIPWSHSETQRVLPRFVNPINREARHAKLPLASLSEHFFAYKPQQSLDEIRKSQRGEESKGANSLYLNMGDKDNDGLVEWKDVSREAGIEGKRSSSGIAVADLDLDGDLDIYVANVMDLDYWPGGSKGWAGGANELYINQLAETGKLTFVEKSSEMGVDGIFSERNPQPDYYKLRRIPFLPVEYSFHFVEFLKYKPKLLEINGGAAEPAEISWSAVFQDYNGDGYPDIWVANDLGMLRLYENQAGKDFVNKPHARSKVTGSWMTIAPADFSGDLKEDIVVGNLGGGMFSNAFVAPDYYNNFDPTIVDVLAAGTIFRDTTDPTHTIIDGSKVTEELAHRVFHSRVLPPETSVKGNYRNPSVSEINITNFDPDTIDCYEFSWGMTPVDVQNDGRPDLYYVGCLYTRGGGLFPVIGSGPGRLLVNATTEKGKLQLVDQTAEYHLFNIEELKYDKLESEGYVYRRSPLQNWRKRDVVHSFDRSIWIAQGMGVQERVTNSDLLQTSENGRAAVAADLNGDGFSDIIVSNTGGYDSRRSNGKNLKVKVNGVARVVPPPDAHYFSLTNFEPGRTRVFVNKVSGNNWLKIRLIDDSEGSFNRFAVGAKVIVNGRYLKVKRAGDGGYSGNTHVDLLFGLAKDQAKSVEIRWPDKKQTVSKLELSKLSNGTLIISKTKGVVKFTPAK